MSSIDLKKLLHQFPNSEQLYNFYGLLLLNQLRFHEAKDAFSKAIEIKKKYSVAYKNLGLVYIKLGEIELAVDNLIKAIIGVFEKNNILPFLLYII